MDDNALFCFIIGTADPVEAEKALRAQEDIWYGTDEGKWSDLEKRLSFSDFGACTFRIRGEFMSWENGPELPPKKGRVTTREGFVTALD